MLKIYHFMFAALFAHMTSYAVIDIEKYLERTPKVADAKQDWVLEFKNKDGEGYLLTIISGGDVIAERLSVLPAKSSSDSFIRVSQASGLNPSIEPTYILLESKAKKNAHAWYIPSGASKIFVSYQGGNLTTQRSGALQGVYASNTTSGLPLKDNVKQSSVQKVDVTGVRKIVDEYKRKSRK